MFKIEILCNQAQQIWESQALVGQLTIHSFQEEFYVSLDNWSYADYLQQWQEGCLRIISDTTSCLVTSVQKIDTDPLVVMWVLYRTSDTIYFQNHMINDHILYNENSNLLLQDFSNQNCYEYIYFKHRTVTELEEPIFEKFMKLSTFLLSLKEWKY